MNQTIGDKIFGAINNTLLFILLLLVLYPLIFVVSASISNPLLVANGELWLFPKELTLIGYQKVFQNRDILSGYLNTILYTTVGTLINLFLTTLGAYPLSRRDFYGKNLIMFFLVFTMFFSGGLIPTYLVIKNLDMLNTFWALVIPNAVAVFNLIIMRSFFQSNIPREIEEAAEIDGCSDFQILRRVVLPLSTPIIAVMILFYSVGHWNAYFDALIYLTDREKFPLQLILREILIQNSMDEMAGSGESMAQQVMYAQSIKYAVVIVANLPVLLLYPFLQKYFVQGIMVGAIKG
ncbi:carbohydrate ABC transporter permease [Bacillus sp. SD088]|uniref:carbohydrate ABC transporter permease n=1 Tax=Bacillus sp. SD088 TaxID=2782012 RepID=UPI001A971D6F|nr:carbohydrate ABC transporter permease [Bacillus sp. SD088]MBO0994688.1 carbohydrate ABC transporter permease [Bacillus sp. SD088]